MAWGRDAVFLCPPWGRRWACSVVHSPSAHTGGRCCLRGQHGVNPKAVGVQGWGRSEAPLSLAAWEPGGRDPRRGCAGLRDEALPAAACRHLADPSAITQAAQAQILRLLPTKSLLSLRRCARRSPACGKYVRGAGIHSRLARPLGAGQGWGAAALGGLGGTGQGEGAQPPAGWAPCASRGAARCAKGGEPRCMGGSWGQHPASHLRSAGLDVCPEPQGGLEGLWVMGGQQHPTRCNPSIPLPQGNFGGGFAAALATGAI